MGKRAGGKDFAPRVRSLVDRVLEKLQLDGDAEELLEQAFRDDFAGTLKAMSAYAPKQVDMSLDQQVSLDTTQLSREVLTEMFSEKSRRDAESDKQVH